MSTDQRIPAKASGPADRSDAVIVSFDAAWHEAIVARTLTAVIRKRIPTSIEPTWLYFHVNSPRSAIVARSRLENVGYVPITTARSMTSELGLNRSEVDEYCLNLSQVGLYRLAGIELASTPAAVDGLRRTLIYWPPQSFLFLSSSAKSIIDAECDFIGGS